MMALATNSKKQTCFTSRRVELQVDIKSDPKTLKEAMEKEERDFNEAGMINKMRNFNNDT